MNSMVLILAGVLLIQAAALMLFALTAYARDRREQKNIFFTRLDRLREEIRRLQLEFPFLQGLETQWTRDTRQRIYEPAPPEDLRWVHYYSLVELCISYCNTVLYGRRRKIIGKDAFAAQYEPFMKEILTKHRRIIGDLIQEGKYISEDIKKYLAESKEENRFKGRFEK